MLSGQLLRLTSPIYKIIVQTNVYLLWEKVFAPFWSRSVYFACWSLVIASDTETKFHFDQRQAE